MSADDDRSGSTRLLFHIALRSLCEGSDELLFLEEPIDRYMTEIELTDTSRAFTESYLASFREDLPEDASKAVLQDRVETGWLAWGRKMEVTRLSGWEEEAWVLDPTCEEGIKIFEGFMTSEGWWQQVSGNVEDGVMADLLLGCRSLGTRRPANISLRYAY